MGMGCPQFNQSSDMLSESGSGSSQTMGHDSSNRSIQIRGIAAVEAVQLLQDGKYRAQLVTSQLWDITFILITIIHRFILTKQSTQHGHQPTTLLIIMQYLKTSPAEPSSQHSSTTLIPSKLIIALTRTLLYTLTIHYNPFQLSSLYINLALAIALFLLAQLAIWYRRFDCALIQQQFNVSLTVLAHLYALANVILLAVSVNLQDHQPREMFFQIFMGQMVNYMLTLIAVHQAQSIFLVKNCEDFTKLFQPVENSMVYLFVAYFMGIFCDFIAFAQFALIELYIFSAIAVLYLAIKGVIVDNLKTKLKKLFAQ